jgi:hypothetical protein
MEGKVMIKFIRKLFKLRSKDNREYKFGLTGRSPHDPNDLYWDGYGVYKKVYVKLEENND